MQTVSTEYRSNISEGILITPNKVRLSFKFIPEGEGPLEKPEGAFLLFDSNDGRAYSDERMKKELHYFEYGEISLDGHTVNTGVRDMKTVIKPDEQRTAKKGFPKKQESIGYTVEAVRFKDHALVKIYGNGQTVETTIALPDSSRFLYMGVMGQYCRIRDVNMEKFKEPVGEGYITRIAEEILPQISYGTVLLSAYIIPLIIRPRVKISGNLP